MTRKDCPICGKKGLVKLSNHLRCVHKISDAVERKHYLAVAKTTVTTDTIVQVLKLLLGDECPLCRLCKQINVIK